ncbi:MULTISPECIES: type IV secretion system protein [Bifidobacterium]|uniref:TrbL/VirB6 plasmid conjugal transfer protein n=2 Tax=Bifidobacterium TaxID=1678 RepID=A0A430FEJ9_9BIFI|nr:MULTISPECIES: type IV secretion system protein [Bifidobacterium]OXN00292.1 hypothetical protein Tam10B_1515 [Bifidobacterium vansinderenii]RSX51266.1 hypothetical protein D2E23_1111 [Bifidobacterium callimiconis]
MEDWLIGLLNTIGNGVSQDMVSRLLQTPADFNHDLYDLSLRVADTAVKPMASIVLAIVFSMELARVSTKVDADRELGMKMVAAAMLRIAIVFTLAQNSELLLKAVDEIGSSMMSGFTSAAPTEGATSTMGLGDAMADQIKDAGWAGQAACMVLLIIPFVVSQAASIVFTVVILLRFVQLYMMTAFNPLPVAFCAHEETKAWGIGYFKQYAVLVFQCATLYLAVIVYRVFVKNVLTMDGFKEGDSLPGWIISNFGNLLLASVLLIGIVMVANGVAKKLFGGE